MTEINDTILEGNTVYLNRFLQKLRYKALIRFNPRMWRMYCSYKSCVTTTDKNAALVQLLDSLEETFVWRYEKWSLCRKEDKELDRACSGHRVRIDNSDSNVKDYYSVAVIIKNEARYIEEFIRFYQVSGADRIYLYDNGSTDELMSVIEPYLKSGFVVYQEWPGRIAQTSAYRDVVKRTKERTQWLALIDSDEFLFSPLGDMREQLKEYEDYPGVGVNWVMFGPNGHETRPGGLVIENYTTTPENENEAVNRHIKSIVQPDKVFIIDHTHYAIYKSGAHAVDEDKNIIDNTYALAHCAGKAFTSENRRRVFRVNHYYTKSLEDLREKCARGYCDGAPNREYEEALSIFKVPLKEDTVILRFADAVRKTNEDC